MGSKFKRIFDSSDFILLLVFLAMIIDYVLSYWGINILFCIKESNPLMVSFMELPFYQGIIMRILISLTILLIIRLLRYKLNNRITYKRVLHFLLIIQTIPYAGHGILLFKYLLLDINKTIHLLH